MDAANRDPIATALERLRVSPAPMNDWERGFVHSVTQRGCTSLRHKTTLAKLVRAYLHDPLLAAEILGQERLFAEDA
jgi:hypothetical protein